ncbi:MAG: hypothetical protein NZ484_01155 [Patescibacteria group bacterium]|nr:hypothetical protein [Patescibacteria group bacterium]MCX7589730.1 hypothetical protein [Patescibacteria group bacterium]MDW8279911.1 hypothetical protein [bacterium]
MIKNNFGDTKDLVEIKDIKLNTVILKNGELRQIVIVGGINFALKSEEEQNIIIQAYQEFLNSLEFPIQIIIHSRKVNIENYLNYLNNVKEKEFSGLLKNQIEEYIQFIYGFIKDNDIMVKTFLVVVPYTIINLEKEAEKITSKFSFFSSQKNEGDKRTDQDDQILINGINQLNQRTMQVIEGLTSIGLDAVQLTDEELLELFYNYYNPETIEKEGII